MIIRTLRSQLRLPKPVYIFPPCRYSVTVLPAVLVFVMVVVYCVGVVPGASGIGLQ
ncbi:hypothetical protein MG5_05692, partial [Candida albicans P57072]